MHHAAVSGGFVHSGRTGQGLMDNSSRSKDASPNCRDDGNAAVSDKKDKLS